jgi:hypothetical protein
MLKLYKCQAAFVFCAVLNAQDFRATITGQVTDASVRSVPNATVKAVNVATGEGSETRTNSEGFYTLPYLNPGTYNVEVSASGFNTLKREAIILRVADKQNLTVTLQVGQVNQEVTVVGQQELIQSTNADRGLVFDPVKTQEYPLNGRQSYMLMALTPGVIFTQEQFGANGFSGTRGWDTNGSYRINGGRTGTNQFLLNGAPISTFGSWQLAPNVEAIQEFKVQTNTYDAQFGRTGGGTVNTTLKAGGSSWHGDVFEYFRTNRLDANTFQNNAAGKPRGKHNQHQFGGVVGGPIRKDKDFIFGSFEGWREVVPFPFVGSTPPLNIRDGQHFTDWNVNVFDPLTTRLCTAADKCPGGVQYARDPFPNNMIPASRISPIGKKILDLYPAPNGNFDNLQNNFLAAGNSGRYRYDQPMGRWDHNFGQNDRFYSLVTFQHGWEYRNNNGFNAPAQRGNIKSERTDQNYIADWTHVFSPTMVLDVRGSFSRFTSYFPDGIDSWPFTYDKLGIKNMPIPPTVTRKTAPVVRLDLYPDIIGTSYSWSTDNHWDFAPSMTKTRGKQTWHFGFEYARVGRGSGGPGLATGRLDFNSRYWTQQYKERGFGQSDGSGIASLLLGLPTGGQIDYNDSYYRTNGYYAVFFQNDWKVRSNVNINLGLRWDVWRPFVEQHDRVNSYFDWNAKNPLSDQLVASWSAAKSQWDAQNPGKESLYPNAPSVIKGGLVFPGVNGQPRTIYDTDWTNIQPRIGIAWQIRPKMVMRGGFGIYHRTTSNGGLTNGFSRGTGYLRSLDGDFRPSAGLTGPYSLENPFPDGYLSPTGSTLGLLTNVGSGLSIDTRNLPTPRIYEMSLGIQKELFGGIVVETSYSGNRAVHEPVGQQWGNVSRADFNKATADPSYLNTALPNPFQGILPAATGFGSSTSINAYDLRRPYPIFPGVFTNTNPVGKYWYDSLQVSMEKRVLKNRSAGVLTFVVSYTFSKSFEANHRLNDWNFAEPLIHELDNNDKPQSFAFSGVWDLPLGKGRRLLANTNKAVDAVFGGWSFDWIYTYVSGYPVGKPDANFTCSDYRVKDQTFDRWLNNDKSCYSDRAPYTLRNVEDRFPNIRNPSEPSSNIALQKTFKFNDRWAFQLRGESFNVTNTPLMPGPNTDYRSPNFGVINRSQQNFPRLVQLAGKVYF